MHVFTNKELTAQVEDLKQQLAKAIAEVAKNRGQQNDIGIPTSGMRPIQPTTPENAEKIYQAYPRKIGKGAAIKAITKALTKIGPYELLCKVVDYRTATAWQQNRSLIPHPATWINQERWLDDPKEWENPEKTTQADTFSL